MTVPLKTLAILTFLLFPWGLSSQSNFRFTANSMTSVLAEGREKTILSGSASMKSDATLIQADRVELSGEDFRFAFATGSVTASDSDRGLLLRCQELRYDRERKVSTISGEAVMEDQKNEMVVKGGYLENYEAEDLIIIQIGVRILKKDLTARSQYARFNRKTDLLELSGLPVVIYKGDEYRAQRITVNVKTNEISMDGNVSGTVVKRKETSAPAAAPQTNPEGQEPAAVPTADPTGPAVDTSGPSIDPTVPILDPTSPAGAPTPAPPPPGGTP